MDNKYKSLLDDTDTMVLVSKEGTHEVLFSNANTYAMKSDSKSFQGKKCYEVLFGKNEICSFCPLNKMEKEDLEKTVEADNGLEIYKVKTKKIRWDEEDAYVEFASNITKEKAAIRREKRLSDCLQLLTEDTNWKENIDEVMKVVQEQYSSDRVYIFEFDWVNDLMSNTYEYCEENVSPEKGNLQDLPIDTVVYWVPIFKDGEAVYIDNLEDIKDVPSRKEEYDILKPQGIVSLMCVPIIKNGVLYGYLGVDNPRIEKKDREFLTSISYFLSQEFYDRERQNRLIELSTKDALTKLNNRNVYNELLDKIAKENYKNVGIVFADVNGLKYVNDTYGHEEGDRLIIQAASILSDFCTKDDLFRISGDEFVICVTNIEQEEFIKRASKLERIVQQNYGSIFAMGIVWRENAEDFQKWVSVAEGNMYENKKKYYEEHPIEKRKIFIQAD